ncbi:MAG TPA: hypothetical protein VMY77_09175 [Chitinophagaceae bacterium]|nr:hypothetical protein [Chitinophagaceae bacterium]
MKTNTTEQNNTPGKELSKGDETVCTCFAIFGGLIAVTSLIQFLVYTTYNFLSLVIIGIYLFNIISYVLLGLLKRHAPLFIFISTLLSFLIYFIFTYAYIFSAIIIILFVCNSIAAIIIVLEKLPAKIKHKHNAEKLEKEYWEGKL